MKIVKSSTTEYSIQIARTDAIYRIIHDHVTGTVEIDFGALRRTLEEDEFKQVQEFVIEAYDDITEE